MSMPGRTTFGLSAVIIAVGLFVIANLLAADSRDAAARVFAVSSAIALLVGLASFFPRLARWLLDVF